MERNCSGTTAASITPSTEQELSDASLTGVFKPVLEVNSVRVDDEERRRRKERAIELFDKLDASIEDGTSANELCMSLGTEAPTLRLTLTPSLVRGDESDWSDELRYNSATSDDDDDETSLDTVDLPCNGIARIIKRQHSNGNITRLQLRTVLSKGSLRVSWIPEEPSEDAQETATNTTASAVVIEPTIT